MRAGEVRGGLWEVSLKVVGGRHLAKGLVRSDEVVDVLQFIEAAGGAPLVKLREGRMRCKERHPLLQAV